MDSSQQAMARHAPPERRRFPRYPFAARVYYRGTVEDEGDGIDISEGGVAFHSRHAIAPGALLDVIFLNRSVTVSGTVRNRVQVDEWWHRIGVEFERREPDIVNVVLAIAD